MTSGVGATRLKCAFFGTRFYDPTIGRFVHMDSLSWRVSNPLGQNRYPYAYDEPMSFGDTTGLDPLGDAWNWLNNE